jgi:hypothetical protein
VCVVFQWGNVYTRASKSIIFRSPSSCSSVPAFAKDEDRNIIPFSVLDSNPAESSRPRIKSIYCQDALRENTRGECAAGANDADGRKPPHNIQTLLINKAQRGGARDLGVRIHLIYFSLFIRISAGRGWIRHSRNHTSALSYKGKLNFSSGAQLEESGQGKAPFYIGLLNFASVLEKTKSCFVPFVPPLPRELGGYCKF